MKKFRLLILISFIALTGGVLWKLWPSKANVPNGTSEGSKASETKSAFPTSAKVIKPDLRPSQPPQTHKNSMTSDPVYQYIQNVRADPQYDWKQPISFYGQVLDENDQPISEANAHFKWTDLSENGTSEADTKSDINGYFSLVNRTGKRMSVTVSKPGYYTPHSERLSSFEYANPADGLFTPDPNEPVIFHLRKKGIGVDLITSQYGMKDYFGVVAALDGTPTRVNLITRKSNDQAGHLILSQRKPGYENWKQAKEWSFRMEIPDGGFVEENDEFPFEAPATGYQPVVEFEFRKGETNWTTGLKKDYYIKFGNPPRYGRLHLETVIEMSGARLTYAVNPDGSRNLELR